MDAKERQQKCDEQIAAGKCGRSGGIDCMDCEYMYNLHEIPPDEGETMFEDAKRETAINVIILYDSGVLKDRIAEMMSMDRNDIDYCINNRHELGE